MNKNLAFYHALQNFDYDLEQSEPIFTSSDNDNFQRSTYHAQYLEKMNMIKGIKSLEEIGLNAGKEDFEAFEIEGDMSKEV